LAGKNFSCEIELEFYDFFSETTVNTGPIVLPESGRTTTGVGDNGCRIVFSSVGSSGYAYDWRSSCTQYGPCSAQSWFRYTYFVNTFLYLRWRAGNLELLFEGEYLQAEGRNNTFVQAGLSGCVDDVNAAGARWKYRYSAAYQVVDTGCGSFPLSVNYETPSGIDFSLYRTRDRCGILLFPATSDPVTINILIDEI
jgi:hypothetical protein